MRNSTIGRCLVRARRTWRDLIFRAIALAALIVVAIILGRNYSNQVDGHNSRQNTEERRESADERIADYTLWLDWVTFALAASTLGLWVATWRGLVAQSRDTRRSLKIAKAAADAAHRSADIAKKQIALAETAAETPLRAYIAVSSITYTGNGVVKIKLVNKGKTPAQGMVLSYYAYDNTGYATEKTSAVQRQVAPDSEECFEIVDEDIIRQFARDISKFIFDVTIRYVDWFDHHREAKLSFSISIPNGAVNNQRYTTN